MMNPSNLSLSEKYKLLKTIKKVAPTKWDDIAYHYGWIPGSGGGLKGNELQTYIMFGLQILKQEKFISINITHNSTRFDSLVITSKGKGFIYLYPIFIIIRWVFVIGIVSVASIKTLFGPMIDKLIME